MEVEVGGSVSSSGVHRRERGAVLVEAAFVFPLLVVFIFGIIEYGFVFKDSLSLSSATRATARSGVAEPRTANEINDMVLAMQAAVNALPSSSIQEMWIYKADPSTGLPPSMPDFNGGCSSSQCVIYPWDAASRTFVKGSSRGPGFDSSKENACAFDSTGNPAGPDQLGVYLKVNHKMLTNLFGSTFTLRDHTVMRLEPVPSNALTGCK